MNTTQNTCLQDYERQYELLIGRIWPDKYEYNPHAKVIKAQAKNPKTIGKFFILTPRNSVLVHDWKKSLESDNKHSTGRRLRLLRIITVSGEMLGKDFDQATRSDLEGLLSKINTNTKWSKSTKWMFRVIIKTFYKWLNFHVHGVEDEYPALVKWIKAGSKKDNEKLPEELLTEEEIRKIIGATDHPMRKAFISVLYETGGRISEVGMLNIRNVQFSGTEAEAVLTGKTGQRRVLLVASVPYLKEWLSIHPLQSDKNAPLFVIVSNFNKGKRMTYEAIRRMIMEAQARAGINKPFNPHHYRHSRATFLASYLNEAQLCAVMGWKLGSNMPRTYIHLSGKQTNDAVRRIYGLGGETKPKESELKPKVCEYCASANPSTNIFCLKCSNPLTLEAMIASKDRMSVMQDELEATRLAMSRMAEVMNKINAKMENLPNNAVLDIMQHEKNAVETMKDG